MIQTVKFKKILRSIQVNISLNSKYPVHNFKGRTPNTKKIKERINKTRKTRSTIHGEDYKENPKKPIKETPRLHFPGQRIKKKDSIYSNDRDLN